MCSVVSMLLRAFHARCNMTTLNETKNTAWWWMLAHVSLGQAQRPHMDLRPCCGIVSVSCDPSPAIPTTLGDLLVWSLYCNHVILNS